MTWLRGLWLRMFGREPERLSEEAVDRALAAEGAPPGLQSPAHFEAAVAAAAAQVGAEAGGPRTPTTPAMPVQPRRAPPPPLPAMASPHFSFEAFGCRDGTPVPPELRPNVVHLCSQLEILRAELGHRPIRVTSGYRTPAWNKARGVEKSQHMEGRAADIRVAGVAPQVVHAAILRLIKLGRMEEGGLGLYLPRPALPPSAKHPKGRAERLVGWVHYDSRKVRARWTG